jgi:hypothetical protein
MMLSAKERTTFAALADLLIPAYGKMPAASAVGTHEALVDAALRARPDLIDGVKRALAACHGKAASQAANALAQSDQEAFAALTLAATGAYYMAPAVREAIGYPGQPKVPYDPHETPDYLTDGTLERVSRRGPMYRPATPSS